MELNVENSNIWCVDVLYMHMREKNFNVTVSFIEGTQTCNMLDAEGSLTFKNPWYNGLIYPVNVAKFSLQLGKREAAINCNAL